MFSLVSGGMLFGGLWLCILGWANSPLRWLVRIVLIVIGCIIQLNYPFFGYFIFSEDASVFRGFCCVSAPRYCGLAYVGVHSVRRVATSCLDAAQPTNAAHSA